jgi:hypothetical protein
MATDIRLHVLDPYEAHVSKANYAAVLIQSSNIYNRQNYYDTFEWYLYSQRCGCMFRLYFSCVVGFS